MNWCLKCWEKHSLTIVLAILGTIVTSSAWLFESGKAFDTLLSLGTAMLTVALFYVAANLFREVAKPED